MKKSNLFGIFLFTFLILGLNGLFVGAIQSYPAPFLSDNSSDVAIIYGTGVGISTLEIIYANRIQDNLKSISFTPLENILVKDYKINTISNHNLIVLGTINEGCSNSAIAQVLGKNNCKEVINELNIGTKDFVIETLNNSFTKGKIVLLVVGYGLRELDKATNYLITNQINTSIGFRYVETTSSPNVTCTETDFGLDYYNKGITTFEDGLIAKDICDKNGRLSEATCSRKSISPYEFYDCRNGCQDGACIKEKTKIINPIWLVYDKNTPTNLDLLTLGNLNAWLIGENIDSLIKKNSEVNWEMIQNDRVTVFVYNQTAVIFYGNANTLYPVWAGNIMSYLKTQKSVNTICELVNANEIKNDDFKNYLCNNNEKNINDSNKLEIDEKVEINPTDETGPIKIKEKEIKTDGKDKKEIEEIKKAICNGCVSGDKCYPFSYRTSRSYCDIESGELVKQLSSDETCNNNFECGSNVCISNKCIDESFINKILNWFKRFFGK